MRLIVCLDERGGMSFCGKRQSRDSAVCEKIAALTAGSAVWMNAYSASLFKTVDMLISVDEVFLDKAGEKAYCFAENVDVSAYLEKAEELIVFYWNRHYPSDKKFPAVLPNDIWKRKEKTDFTGTSHEKITMEVYCR